MSIPRNVWLVRHGQTDWNHQRRYLSHSDRVLTPYGRLQADALARHFAARKIDVIVHSGLARTRDTALAIAGQRKLALIADERWREASHGAWEGLTYSEVLAHDRADAQRRFADPVNAAPRGGESLRDLAARISAAYRDLGERSPNQRVLIVTHGGAVQALLCQLLNTPLGEHWRWRIDLGSATGFDCYPGATIMRAVNLVPMFRQTEDG
jgi:alpha-ribazole phosphatase